MTDLLDRASARANLSFAKSMQDLHPEMFDGTRVHVMTVQHDEAPDTQAYSYLAAIRDYAHYVWVRKAVTLIANAFAPLPLEVWRSKKLVEGHDLAKLYADVNDKLSSADLWTQWIVDMLLGGEEGHELVRRGNRGPYTEIWPRAPNIIHVVPDAAQRRYYGVAEYCIDDGLAKSYPLPPDEFMHFKFFNPQNPWRGIGLVTAVRTGIQIDQFAQAWSRLFFRKSARPDFAIIAPAGLTKDEREDIIKQVQEEHGGLHNAHQPIVLEQGVSDIKVLDFRPKDMEWLAQRQVSRDEVAAIFGVPDILMGFGNDSYDTQEKRIAAEAVLWSLTVMPLVRYRDTSLTEWHRRNGTLKPDESIVTDTTGVAALREDFGAKVTQAVALFGMGYPVNVINDSLDLGLPPVRGGDVGYLSLALVPVTSAEPTKNVRSTRHKDFEFGSDEHKALWERKDRRLDPQRREMMSGLDKAFARQQREVKSRVRAGKSLPVAPSGNGNGSGPAILGKISADDVFDVDEEANKFGKQFKPVVSDAVGAAGQDALDALSLMIVFDLDRPEVRAAMQDILDEFAQKTNETTYSGMADLFQQAEADGVGISGTMDLLDTYFQGRRSEASLERIARTTMTSCNGAGDVTAWGQSGVVEERSWMAALDDRTRDDHRNAHGQVVALDEPFDVGGEELMFPGDPQGSPENIINCRCTQRAIVAERSLMPAFIRRQRGEELSAPIARNAPRSFKYDPDQPRDEGGRWGSGGAGGNSGDSGGPDDNGGGEYRMTADGGIEWVASDGDSAVAGINVNERAGEVYNSLPTSAKTFVESSGIQGVKVVSQEELDTKFPPNLAEGYVAAGVFDDASATVYLSEDHSSPHTLTHEAAHAVDRMGTDGKYVISEDKQWLKASGWKSTKSGYTLKPTSDNNPFTEYAKVGPWEDFAETVAVALSGSSTDRRALARFSQPRYAFVKNFVREKYEIELSP